MAIERKTWVYFVETNGWTEYTTGFLDAIEYVGRRFLGGLSNLSTGETQAAGVFEAVEGTLKWPPAVPAVPVLGVMESGWIRLGGPGARARVRRIEMTMSGDTVNTIDIEMFRDYDDQNVYVTRNVSLGENSYPGSSGGNTERVLALDGWGNRLTSVKFRVTTRDVNIENLDIFYTGGTEGSGQNLRGETYSGGVGGQPRQGG